MKIIQFRLFVSDSHANIADNQKRPEKSSSRSPVRMVPIKARIVESLGLPFFLALF